MNFEDLLDEDGQGTRELDSWLFNTIEDSDRISAINEKSGELYSIKKDGSTHIPGEVPHYTTGDSIDSIYSLADDYFNIWTLRSHGKYEYSVETPNQCDYNEFMTPQLAIAEALFKAYQEKEDE